MLVVGRWRHNGGPDSGTPVPQLRPVERLAEGSMDGGGNRYGLDSGQMPTHSDL